MRINSMYIIILAAPPNIESFNCILKRHKGKQEVNGLAK